MTMRKNETIGRQHEQKHTLAILEFVFLSTFFRRQPSLSANAGLNASKVN